MEDLQWQQGMLYVQGQRSINAKDSACFWWSLYIQVGRSLCVQSMPRLVQTVPSAQLVSMQLLNQDTIVVLLLQMVVNIR